MTNSKKRRQGAQSIFLIWVLNTRFIVLEMEQLGAEMVMGLWMSGGRDQESKRPDDRFVKMQTLETFILNGIISVKYIRICLAYSRHILNDIYIHCCYPQFW